MENYRRVQQGPLNEQKRKESEITLKSLLILVMQRQKTGESKRILNVKVHSTYIKTIHSRLLKPIHFALVFNGVSDVACK